MVELNTNLHAHPLMSIFQLTPITIDAQRAIDEEISDTEASIQALKAELVRLEASILDLKAKRNNHSDIGKLPSELMAKIFVEGRQSQWESLPYYGLSKAQRWSNISAVCTRWRSIVTNTPHFWKFFELGPNVERVAETLRRSGNSTPLRFRARILQYELDEHEAAVMEAFSAVPQFDRYQELDLVAPRSIISYLASAYQRETAPSLEVINLDSSSFELMTEIHLPLLRDLRLVNGTLLSVLPPLPSLRRLSIISAPNRSGLPINVFIESLRKTDILEEITATKLILPRPGANASLLPVSLPYLSNLSIHSSTLDGLEIFNLINHPISTIVNYQCDTRFSQSLSLAGIATLCSRFAANDAPSINQVSISVAGQLQIALFTEISPLSPHVTLSLPGPSPEMGSSYMQQCSPLPLSTVPGLTVGGLSSSRFGFELLQPFEQVEVLKIFECTHAIFNELIVGDDGTAPPLPKLRTLIMSECEFSSLWEDEDEDEALMLDALKRFLTQRKLSGKGIDRLVIECCGISDTSIEALEQLVELEWDGVKTSMYEYESQDSSHFSDSDFDSDSDLDLDSDDELNA